MMNDTLNWARELDGAIRHAIAAHSQHSKSATDAVRFHDNKTPYVVHPLWCAAMILAEPQLPEEIRRIGSVVLLWHDILEDTDLPLPESANAKVAETVREMTFASFDEETCEIWTRSELVRLLKLYDKVSNLLDGCWMDDDLWNRYVELTVRLAEDAAARWRGLNILSIARAVAVRRGGGQKALS